MKKIKQTLKRMAVMLLMAATLINSVPMTAFAGPDDPEGTAVSTWEALQTGLSAGGDYYLSEDITAGESDTYLSVPSGVTAVID